jgi:mannose-1-phosphate guanylyltransferase/mannose-6-phosphate isomerase
MQVLNKSAYRRNYKFVNKPWGDYLVLEKHPSRWLKKLFVSKGEQLSWQSHKNRFEVWVALQGKIRVQKGSASFVLQKGDYLKIRKKEKHRIFGLTNANILEAALGQPKESDIACYQGKYGRAKEI